MVEARADWKDPITRLLSDSKFVGEELIDFLLLRILTKLCLAKGQLCLQIQALYAASNDRESCYNSTSTHLRIAKVIKRGLLLWGKFLVLVAYIVLCNTVPGFADCEQRLFPQNDGGSLDVPRRKSAEALSFGSFDFEMLVCSCAWSDLYDVRKLMQHTRMELLGAMLNSMRSPRLRSCHLAER